MIAGQKLVANDGYEVALFPMPYMYMTQDEGGDYSHQGTYNIDFIGWSESGRVYNAPIYAPCTMKVMQFYSGYVNGNTVAFQSVNKVHLPNGQLDYLTIEFAHDNNPPHTIVGDIVQQGDLCYHTGTYGNVTGDHVHTCMIITGRHGKKNLNQNDHFHLFYLQNACVMMKICYTNISK